MRVLRENVFTFFNNILFVIGTALLLLGRPGDAFISVGIGLLNALISSAQELRARRALERMHAAGDMRVTVERDREVLQLAPAAVSAGDLLLLRADEPVVADGPLVSGRVEVDESAVTGETRPVVRGPGERLLAGTVCVGGSGVQRVEAGAPPPPPATRHARTPLQDSVDFLVRLIMLTVAVISLAILGQAVLDGQTLTRFVQTTAVLSGLVPYGLFLLITVAYAGGAAAIGRQGVLVQRIGAVEALSSVDVLCTDKTGTLTGPLQVAEIEPVDGVDRGEVETLLGGMARAASGSTPLTAAIARALPGTAPAVRDRVPFSPERRWGGLVTDRGALVLGAPDVLGAVMDPDDRARAAAVVDPRTAAGSRVIVLARATADAAGLRDPGADAVLPRLRPLAVVALQEELRPGVVEAVAGLRAEGVRLKVLSGDDPRTVAAVAAAAGLPATRAISGDDLAGLTPEVFAAEVAEHDVFGRLAPAQKEQVVAALRHGGARVAMVGNGVNDLRAMRRSQVAIAMGGGSAVTRDAADVVLVDDAFADLLPALHRGRLIVGGIVTSMHLFLARVAIATLIIMLVTMLGLGFPYEPAQVGLTLFTVGLPSFFLTFWADPQRVEDGLLAGLARFVLPAALVTAAFAAGLYAYLYTRVVGAVEQGRLPANATAYFAAESGLTSTSPGFADAAATLAAQTGMSVFVSVTGVLLILFLRPPVPLLAAWRPATGDVRPVLLVLGLLAALLMVVLTPPLAEYFKLLRPVGPTLAAVGWAVAGWLVVQWLTFRFAVLDLVLGLRRPASRGSG